MKIQIIPFQTDPKCSYEVSHKYLHFLEDSFNEFLSDFNSDLKLILSIVCLSENEGDLLLGGSIKHRGKGRQITQQIILPNRHLYLESDYVFKLKKFDFELFEDAYQTYPLDLFSKYSFEGILKFLGNNKLELPENEESEGFVKCLIVELNEKSNGFRYQTEELMCLEELINNTHWAYEENDGKEWLDSEIGKKWLKLSEKYCFDNRGKLTLKARN